MKVHVKLFAVARQRIGHDSLEIELPDEPTIRHLRASLVEHFPALADIVTHSRLAINNEYAPDTFPIPPIAEIALIPPVSGG
jgi:molybdopterin converting factor subunit 1